MERSEIRESLVVSGPRMSLRFMRATRVRQPASCVGTYAWGPEFSCHVKERRTAMPVILLWAVPAVFVLGGLTYVMVR
jgi:hypothetical protein